MEKKLDLSKSKPYKDFRVMWNYEDKYYLMTAAI